MEKHINLVLLSGPIFSSNMGCNALTYGSLEILSEIASNLKIKFRYTLLDNPSKGMIPAELDRYEISLFDHLPDIKVKRILRAVYQRKLKELFNRRAALKKNDIFLDNCWGDSFSDIYGMERFNSIYRHYHFAKSAKKPLILLPQTIGPFKSEESRSKAREVLAYAHAIFTRDPMSTVCAQQILPSARLYETVDVAMFMPYSPPQSNEDQVVRIGLNVSGLLWKGGYTRNNQFNIKGDYQSIVRKIINFLQAENNISIEFVGHDISGPSAGNSFEDYYVCKLLKKEFPECSIAPFFYSPVEAKSYIAGLDGFIGSRMHACIAAYSSGVPVFPIAYSRKFRGLFEEKLEYSFGACLSQDEESDVLVKLERFINQLSNIKQGMVQNLKKIDEIKSILINDIAKVIATLT